MIMNAVQLTENVKELRTEATGHKKAARYHRRRTRECLSEAERYEQELARLGIKLEIQKPK